MLNDPATPVPASPESVPAPRKCRPLCPIHQRPLLVRRVTGQVQYRYCPVEGCHSAARTFRDKTPRPRTRVPEEKPTTVPDPVPLAREISERPVSPPDAAPVPPRARKKQWIKCRRGGGLTVSGTMTLIFSRGVTVEVQLGEGARLRRVRGI